MTQSAVAAHEMTLEGVEKRPTRWGLVNVSDGVITDL